MAQACLAAEVVARTDGWQAYRVLSSESRLHVPTVTGSGKNAGRLFPWVHTLIANVKGNIRGVYHGVSDKHLPRYLGEFCYRFNRRFWKPQMFKPDDHCLSEYSNRYSFGAKAINILRKMGEETE